MNTNYWMVDVLDDELGQPWGTADIGSIFKCPEHMKAASPSSYEPIVLTLGPYAPKGAKYAWLDTLKLDVARATALSRGVTSDEMAELVRHVGGTPEEIKLKFGSKPNMKLDEVQRILAIDSLFVAGILVKACVESNFFPSFVADDESWQTCLKSLPGFGEDEPAYRAFQQGMDVIIRDLFLLENQIPVAFLKRALMYAIPRLTGELAEELLCHCMRRTFFTMGFVAKLEDSYLAAVNSVELKSCEHLLHLYYLVATGLSDEGRYKRSDIGHLDFKLPAISELQLFGLRLKGEPSNLSISLFDKGSSTIHLPQITVTRDTETLIRNLLAFEFLAEKPPVVSSYVMLMDHLIDTVSDVALMRKYRVLECDLGEDESVRDLWNRFTLGDLMIFKRRAEEFRRIMDARNIVKKHVWDMYRRTCSSLYLILSLVAGSILLSLAFLQTLYSVLGYYRTP